jgi:hypothetical protein
MSSAENYSAPNYVETASERIMAAVVQNASAFDVSETW